MTIKAPNALVVDDNPDVACAMAMLLQMMGVEASAAYSGQSAVEAVQQAPHDVVFLNPGMPGMDGYEAARRIRAVRPDNIPVLVAVTGCKSQETRWRVREAGFDHSLIKPVSAKALLLLLAHANRRSRSGR